MNTIATTTKSGFQSLVTRQHKNARIEFQNNKARVFDKPQSGPTKVYTWQKKA